MPTTTFRDPVHGDITLHLPADQVVLDVVDTPEFQRLRRVRQLALASFAFHGAEHSRFTHSLGAFWLMRRTLDHLASTSSPAVAARIAAARQVAELTALLHDVGHGPFSHAFEKVLTSQDHETTAHQLLLDPSSGIARALVSHGVDPAQVVALHEGRGASHFLSQLTSSQLDVDRMDYLLRDATMTGARYGNYDLERLIHALVLVEEGGELRLAVERKGLAAVEHFILARSFMHEHVYHHKTIESAEVLLQATLQRAATLARAGELVIAHPALRAVLLENRLDLPSFARLDDGLVISHLAEWQDHPDATLCDLSRRFFSRRLLKTLRLPGPLTEAQRAGAAEAVRASGYDPTSYLHELTWRLTALPTGEGTGTLRVRTERGLLPLADASELLRPLAGKTVVHHLLVLPEAARAGVRALLAG